MDGLKTILEAVQQRIDAEANANGQPAIEGIAQRSQGDHPAVVHAQEAVVDAYDDSDPNDENDEEQEPQEAPQEPLKPTYLFNDCHEFRLSGNSLLATDRKGNTVVLIAPQDQRIADLLKAVLGKKPQTPGTNRKKRQTLRKKRRAAK